YSPVANLPTVAIPTLADDVVYVSTGQGADCAIDANAGRIVWLAITETAKQQRSPSEYYNPQFQFVASWRFNAPLVYGDKLICFDLATSQAGSSIHIYNRWNGTLLRTLGHGGGDKPVEDIGDATVDVMAGILGSKLILVGSQVLAVDLDTIEKTGHPIWTM